MAMLTTYYKNLEGKRFDLDYYLAHHLPLIQKLAGGALKRVAVNRGIAGGEPDFKPMYLVVAHLHFEDMNAFQNSLLLHFAEIMRDVPNYTDIEPVFEISETVR